MIFVRHGQTNGNVRGSFGGWTDLPLNETGREQAEMAAEKLKDEKIDAIYASPLSRALDTAKIINKYHGHEIIVKNELKERNFGKWEDQTFGFLKKNYPDEVEAWLSDWANYEIEGGESTYQSYTRVINFMNDLTVFFLSILDF